MNPAFPFLLALKAVAIGAFYVHRANKRADGYKAELEYDSDSAQCIRAADM